MSVLESQTLQPEFIKMRWMEPYVSEGLNRRNFKNIPRGVYSGFVVEPGPGSLDIQIRHNNPEGYGEDTGFSEGSFDPASSGWSVAVHSSLQGYATTIAILHAVGGANDFVFSLSGHVGETVYCALDVDYHLGFATTGAVKIVDATELDADPSLINLARVDVPASGPISDANIIYDDPAYPRVLPFANQFKYGYMSKTQAALLEEVASISGTPAFVTEVLITEDGSPQTIPLPTGFQYVVGGDDLWVWKNGSYKTKGADRDYVEVDRGDGYGEEISYVGPLRAGDRIKFRVQKFSSVLTGKVNILDESALITQNALDINFSGTGVTVLPDGPKRAKVVIPGGGGGAPTKTKTNQSGASIASYRAVSILADNTIKAFDPTVSGESFYGLTIQMITDGTAGDVQLDGLVEGAGSGVSGSIGDDVFVSHNGDGSLTTLAPSPLNGQVIKVGFLDGPNVSVSGVAVDLVFDRERLA